MCVCVWLSRDYRSQLVAIALPFSAKDVQNTSLHQPRCETTLIPETFIVYSCGKKQSGRVGQGDMAHVVGRLCFTNSKSSFIV